MSARSEGLLLVGLLTVLSFVFQVQFKLYANEIAEVLSRGGVEWIERVRTLFMSVLNWRPILIGILATSLLATWFMIVSRLELSVALPFASISIAFNALASGYFLGEHMSFSRVGGILVIAAGVGWILRN